MVFVRWICGHVCGRLSSLLIAIVKYPATLSQINLLLSLSCFWVRVFKHSIRIQKSDKIKTPGLLDLPDLENIRIRCRTKAAEVAFKNALISTEADPAHKELPFF